MVWIYVEDLFEVKVEIIKFMVVFDLMGDWMGWGVRVFDNFCIVMGEEFVGKFYFLLEDL